MVATEVPILSRIDRLDNMVSIPFKPRFFLIVFEPNNASFFFLFFFFLIQLRQLEEIRGYNRSPKSSCASTPTSGSDGRISSVDFSPKSLEKHCRPIETVIMETGVKGTLIERLKQVEDRMLKVTFTCVIFLP